ncbi:MAG: hypothetical protein WBA22_19485 [Candidatus Methanofastidiosia archaeon]
MWCIPELNDEFIERMMDILEIYERDYNVREPVICFDEKNKQLTAHTREPLPASPGSPERYDYEISSQIDMIKKNLQELAKIAKSISVEEDSSKVQNLKEEERRKIDDTISKISSLKEHTIVKEAEIDEYQRHFSNVKIREGQIVEIGMIELKAFRNVESMIIEIQPEYKKSFFEFWKSNPDYSSVISISGDQINEYEDVVQNDGKIQAYFFKTRKGVPVGHHGIWQVNHSSASSILLKIECKDVGGDSFLGNGPTETILLSIKVTIVEKNEESLKKGKELLNDILDIIERQLRRLRSFQS